MLALAAARGSLVRLAALASFPILDLFRDVPMGEHLQQVSNPVPRLASNSECLVRAQSCNTLPDPSEVKSAPWSLDVVGHHHQLSSYLLTDPCIGSQGTAPAVKSKATLRCWQQRWCRRVRYAGIGISKQA